MEDFAHELAGHLRVTVIAASTTTSITSNGDLTVRRFAVPRTPLSLLRPSKPSDWVPIMQTLIAGRNAVESLVKVDRPDHLFALWALPCGYWAESAARRYDLPFSVWALGSDIWGLRRVPFARTQLKKVLQRATHRYADGLQLAHDVEEICNLECRFLPSSRRLPPPTEADVASAPPYKLAFLGRWHLNKGVDLLLESLAQLTDQDWELIAEVRINGGGPLEDHVRRAALAITRQHREITVGGYLDKQGAANLIGWADYLLLPSRVESIPVIFSDAVQLKTPIVATPVGDLPRLYSKYQFGVVASEANVNAYAAALRAALRQSASAFQPAIELAQRDFDLQQTVARFITEAVQPTL